MILKDKYLPKAKYVLPELRKEFRKSDVNKKKYLWTITLKQRLNLLNEAIGRNS